MHTTYSTYTLITYQPNLTYHHIPTHFICFFPTPAVPGSGPRGAAAGGCCGVGRGGLRHLHHGDGRQLAGPAGQRRLLQPGHHPADPAVRVRHAAGAASGAQAGKPDRPHANRAGGTYACIYAYMYVCMYVHVYMHVYIYMYV